MECRSNQGEERERLFVQTWRDITEGPYKPDDEKATTVKRKPSMDLDQLSPGKKSRDTPIDPFDETAEEAGPMNWERCSNLDQNSDVPSQLWVRQFHSMNKHSQKQAISSLISSMTLQQARQIRLLVEPFFQRDFLSETPAEVGLQILSYLEPEDLVQASRVSKHWRTMCEDSRMWHKTCLDLRLTTTPVQLGFDPLWEGRPTTRFSGGWCETALPYRSLIINHFNEYELQGLQGDRSTSYGTVYKRCSWKSAFLRWRRIISNWKNRKVSASCVLKGHEDNVITCLQVHGDEIVTGSDDHTLKVWSISRGVLLHTLAGHHGGVWTAQIDAEGRYVVSGSTDRTVKIWSLFNYECLYTLLGHTSTVRCLAIHGDVVVSGSRDATLRSWSLETGTLLRQFVGHLAAVRCVQFDGDRVVSGAYDFAVKVWNARDGSCMFTLQGHTNRVYSLVLDAKRNLVISGSLDTSIRVWDISPDKGDCMMVLIGHTSLTSGMQLLGDMLISCNADSTIRVWNIRDGTCVHRLAGINGHGSAITSLQLVRDGLIVTSSDDGSVKLWDIHRGVFVRDLLLLRTCGSGGCVWRLKATDNLLVCAVGSRNGTEETKLVLFDFDASYP